MNQELKQWLEAFNKGEIVRSYELSGMSINYESHIQYGAIKTLEYLKDVHAVNGAYPNVLQIHRAVSKHIKAAGKNYEISSAQESAIRNIVRCFWLTGIENTIKEAGEDRLILLQKHEDFIKIIE